ncbi:unnamed protein product [Arabidopsis lyrata]|uniref:Uncharacterized protein n=1 Tax=Arabidopsis lyrata subsp. lyrata TaxID=81972 RepID=D7MB12_ARALL|nr:nucleolar protein 58 [Arabidopsis lyrata subsp. lyrata]EFH43234.1 hypothetical protein ARALYDRAFT_912652 [Arabidopsis lyrata subsp. lyrata]CAH8274063.1 unnamed protein product [Arabidopsis lyrata]|eukprot:XP_002866975.1 nucleolar protein 58 [Arabidopsis lyrata subsp. lyrata]
MSDNKDHDSDSDAPEEFTQEQAKLEDEALRKIQRENKTRISREKKERRKLMAEKITPRKSRKIEKFEDIDKEEEEEPEENSEALAKKGFLSKDIIDFLAEREKQNAESDSEEDEIIDELPRKKKQKSSGIETVIYKDIPPPECLKTGLDFLKMRRAQVPRSSSVIKNSGQALRLATGAALAKKQRQRK